MDGKTYCDQRFIVTDCKEKDPIYYNREEKVMVRNTHELKLGIDFCDAVLSGDKNF